MLNIDKYDTAALPRGAAVRAAGLGPYICACTGVALLAGLFVPAIFATPPPNIFHPRLGFLYVQYNPDAPNFFYSAIDFPHLYSKIDVRASRPLFSLITRPLASAVAWTIRHAAPQSRLARVRWGGHLAAEHISIYYGWIAANSVLLMLLLWLAAAEMLRWLHPADVRIGLLLLTLTPAVLLSVTQLHTNIAGWTIVAASISFWLRFIDGRKIWPLGLPLGILLLAKMHISLLLLGVVLLWRGQRPRAMLALAALIAAPTLLWRAYGALAGIDAGVWELQAAVRSLTSASLLALVKRTGLFLAQQVIGLTLLFNPLALFLLARGALRAPWSSRLMSWAGIAAGFEIIAMFALQRAGAVYLYGLFFITLPLLFAGMPTSRRRAMVSPAVLCRKGCRRFLVIAQLLWLPAALYAQLWLWRHNWWF